MVTLFILGRSIHLPSSVHDWILLLGALAITFIALARVDGIPTAVLGGAAGIVTYVIDKHMFLPATIAFVAVLAWLSGKRMDAERPGSRAAREGLLLGAGFLIYEQGRAAFVGAPEIALRNGERVLALERRWHVAVESTLQQHLLGHETLLRLVNGFYSWAYLPIVLGTILWLYLTDDDTYRLMRAALGISVVLALTTIALFPVAPPRLVSGSGLVGTHALLGRSHGFVNPYAAIPSFHVGWTALSGYALWRSTRGRWRWFWAFAPVTLMTATVIVTGHHFWVDGLVGTTFTLLPVAILTHRPAWRGAPRGAALPQRVRAVPLAHWSIGALGVLLLYLLVRQAVDPGFTHYWGYMVAQIAATIAILAACERHFAAQGGLSWLTYAVVVAVTWADTLGTAGHMYDRYSGYDKITHFGGGLAITAVAADLLFARLRKRGEPQPLRPTLQLAIGIALALNIGWEIYEYLGDRVFSTGRHAGWLDTTYDLISDTVGGLVALALLARIEPRRFARAAAGSAASVGPHPGRPPRTRRQGLLPLTGRPRRAALWCGAIVPFVIVAFVAAIANVTPGYDHISDTVSDLGAQGEPNAMTMRLGLVLSGLLVSLFAFGLASVVPGRRAAIGAALTLFGGSLMLTGVFQDYGDGARNAEGFLHNTFGVLAVIALLAGMTLVGRMAAEHAAWAALAWPSALAAAIVAVSGLVFLAGPERIDGLAERVLYFTAFGWLLAVSAMALHVDGLRRDAEDGDRPTRGPEPPAGPRGRPSLPNVS